MAAQKHNTKHTNQVRIIGGTHRGRKLVFRSADGLRPTPDMVREKLFNWLGQDLTGKTVLDLFAGSGALGLESASRYAADVVLVESNRQTVQSLKENIRVLGLTQTQAVCADAFAYLSQTPQRFDVVFLDPPFAWQDWESLWPLLQRCLNERAMVYVEAGRLPEFPQWLSPFREGKAGMSRYELRQYGAEAE
ncbi:16S rRNA (guanine(966)-N(2))-methyltransferase RsmD [Neisseria lisongii]|uniref:16S rRNA (Guanine(966)-N(2))-methyltransferase RsmD n=1 Tax=Neisseria lisongii TaxID=2912188 RepID=A0AAW5AKE0_9NEIS|nr:16S rRNA (guanine(966)-N(2))-methyltransferase RsmD [Neisseria lisongii]MCF7530562.1 16S rRNA (guanine(966)-N(2))-methyltransferase RsmD [Neisseria lisongii]